MCHSLRLENQPALSIGIVKRLIENGYTTLDSILTTPEQLMEIEGFKETLSNKIVSNIREKIGYSCGFGSTYAHFHLRSVMA